MSTSPEFSPEEQALIDACPTPEAVQQFLETLEYNFDDDAPTLQTLRKVLRTRVAHCIEGALAAATILSQHGYDPLLLCIEARDIDHILFIYEYDGKWGAIGQSRDPMLKGRPPEFSTHRDLVLSYHPHYWNYFTGDRSDLTIRGFTAFDLRCIEANWQTGEEDPWSIDSALYDAEYEALFPSHGRTRFKSHRDESITWLE